MNRTADIGVVAIGRNEGERLRRSLRSLERWRETLVYVDSGSTDDSREFARSMGVDVVELDTRTPFTAGRARNAGLERLVERHPHVRFVQFVDGDCEVAPEWIDRARERLASDPGLGVVCGRRRERFPDASIWNRLCDMEWNTPVGPAGACGGDALFRLDAFRAAGGFDPVLVAGEEPELCVRLRAHGFRVERLDLEMTLHDAAMTRFGQWWRRASRNGHAIVGGLVRHGPAGIHDYGRQLFRALFWVASISILALVALVVPFATSSSLARALACAAPVAAWAFVVTRTFAHRRRRGDPARHAALYAFFVVLGKVPECLGAWACWRAHRRGAASHWIEYKPVPAAAEERP